MGQVWGRQFSLLIITADASGTTSTSYFSVMLQAVVSIGPNGENQ